MQVSVETTSALERRMTVEIPAEKVQEEVENRLKSIARTTKIDGFRPGKVPFNVIRKRYEGQVLQEVTGEMIQSTFYEAVVREKLQPVGMPSINPKPAEGEGIGYVATFEVYPELELASLDQVEIEKPVAEIAEQDIDNMMEKVRKQRAEWVAAEGAAQNGNRVVIDFKGTIEGEEFAGNAGTQMPVELGSGRMIAGFEEQLLGVKAGDEKTLALTFPADYHAENLAGKPVEFAVTVHKVEESQLPEINEEFAKSMGIEDGSIEQLRKQISESMAVELEHQLRAKIKQNVSDKLFEINTVEIPQAMVQQDMNAAVKRMGLPEGYQIPDAQKGEFEEAARKRVAIGLIFSEILKSNSLTVPPERLREEVEKIASTYEDSQKVIDWYYGDKSRLGEIEAVVLEDMIVDWVLDNAKVKEVKSSFDEIVTV